MSFGAALEPIPEWMADGVIARAAAVVLHRGAVVAERYWGTAADGGALDDATLLPFASLTKPSLMTALLRLVDRGTFSLSRTLGEVLPGARDALGAISVEQLLTHTAGFPEFVPGVAALEARGAPLEEYVRATLAGGVLFGPGTRVLYSNAGFLVLGALVEAVTGTAIPALLSRETFLPLGMTSTTLLPLARPGARMARVELGAERGSARTEIYNSAYFKRLGRADAGLFATPRDVARLLEAYRRDGAGVVSAALAREAITSRTQGLPGRYGPYEWASCDFGWSWEIRGDKSPHPTGPRTSPATFGHIGGSGALAFCDPARELSVVLHTLRDFSDGWAAERPYLTRVATGLVEAADGARG